MFPFPIAKPQTCDIQTFYGTNASGGANRNAKTWNKPVGVSHVYIMLIGSGGNGDGTNGGGSGAVTVWYGAAQNVPDSLLILTGAGQSSDTAISYRGNSLVPILSAPASTGVTGASATTAGPFAASGFFKSTAGQAGWGGDASPSSTTFLLGGSSSGGTSTANYGYTRLAGNGSGYLLMQPIIVGMSGGGTGNGGIGCGGGLNSGAGGPGMVLIASW